MAVRTLEQIISELNPTYNPQVESLRQRQGLIPGQIESEEKGLQAKQETAFGDILGGARRRGLGFSGIPLGEQARYTSTEFLPALARLRQSGREQAMSLEDAINGIMERRNTLAQQLQQGDQQRDLAERQFAEQQRQFNEQLAAQRRAAAASVARPTFAAPSAPAAPAQTGIEQVAFNDAYTRLNSQSDDEILSDIRATRESAGYGNQKDLAKLQVYAQYRPDLFDNPNSLVRRSNPQGKGGGW